MQQRSLLAFEARLRAFMDAAMADSAALPDESGVPTCRLGERASGPDAVFNRLALDLFALQFEQVEAYRRLCDARGVSPDRLEHWTQVPCVPTAAFRDWAFTSLAPEERTHVFQSSGTTAQRRSRHYHSDESLRLYEAAALPWFRRHLGSGAAGRAVFLALSPPAEQVPHSSLAHMFGAIAREWRGTEARFAAQPRGDGTWGLDLERTLGVLRRACEQDRPVTLLGTAFHLVHLLDSLSDRGWSGRLRAGSQVMETGGFKGRSRELSRDELHGLLGRRLGIPAGCCVGEYGMTELNSQAYDWVAGADQGSAGRAGPREPRRFRFPPWARARVVCAESGQTVAEGGTGLLQVFDLANVRSVLAVQTEDMARRCGNGFSLLGRVPQAEPRGCALLAA
jgi:hypothetical protein